MRLLDKALSCAIKNFAAKHGNELAEAVEKVNYGGTPEDMDAVVQDYFYLLKAVHEKKPKQVILDSGDPFTLTTDGTAYDFELLIRHDDQRNTARMMEIEVLTGSGAIPVLEIEKRLNRKIQKDWQ